MQPNDKFLKTFPHEILPEEKSNYRSGCLRIGAYIVLRKIISDSRLNLMLARVIGKDAGLFLDLAVYSIITEDNAGQYYPDYAFNHPLMTEDMRIYSDSKVSEFLAKTTENQKIQFLNEWNEKRDHREKIYISYDSTNKNCQVGEIDMVEFGHPKDDQGKEIFNYSIAYDRDNREPLYYEAYPGSIVDISQLKHTLEKAKGYGYLRNAWANRFIPVESIRSTLTWYFVIVTSAKMNAEEALNLYKSRDGSEKLFSGAKSYLGAKGEWGYSNESIDTKLFTEFVATIIRSKMYTLLKDEMNKQERKQNYMTVPAAIKELEKIEMLKGADNEYRLDYAVTATQKAILKAFGLTAECL